MKLSTRFLFWNATFVLIFPVWTSGVSSAETKPTVWISPPGIENGRCFRELFERPDEWKDARAAVDVLFYTDLNLKRHFTDDELRAWFAKMGEWKLKLAMEVGALKPWGQTGAECFEKERANWERLQSLGANFYAIAMDEPLSCAREQIHQNDEYAVQETANYIALVRKQFPNMLIGDIETFPSLSIDDHKRWIDALQKRLAELNVRGLDFYRLDVDSMHFTVHQKGSWKDVKQLELFCRQRKLPFSLIYWAAGYPSLAKRGLADDSTWYVSVMQQAYDYVAVDGHPDQYVIESWVGAPAKTLPDSGEFTFTRTVRDFAKKFVK